MGLYQYKLSLPESYDEKSAYLITQLYDQEALSVSVMKETGQIKLVWLFQDTKDIDLFKTNIHHLEQLLGFSVQGHFEVNELENINWLEETYKKFPPFSVGPFYIYGSHFKGPKPSSKIPLNIDAATAFGSGEHPTTKGCLLLLEKLYNKGEKPKKIIDVGTGSGILAIAAHKLFSCFTIATDIDPESIKLAEVHINKNDIGKNKIKLICTDGLKDKDVKECSPYNLLLANILAEPLIKFSDSFIEILDKNSYLILSGILDEQSEKVLASYTKHPAIQMIDKISEKGWTTLLLEKT